MIRVDTDEQFPITVALYNEVTGLVGTGEVVYYDVRDSNDSSLSPSISGILPESSVVAGVYKKFISIPDSGNYILYTYTDNYLPNTEEIIVNDENVYTLIKSLRHYNIMVEDVIRTDVTPTASQTSRNVPLNKTDYVITKIKWDSDTNWDNATIQGIVYAHYRSITDVVPYKMDGE